MPVVELMLIGLAAALHPPMVTADTLPSPAGLWLIENGNAVIRIERCDEELCGSIHWLREGGLEVDEHNPDQELRDRPLCGLRILEGFTMNPDRPTEWRDGELYAADEGSTYRGRIRVEESDRLDLRGYRGIALFGRSQTWTRVSEEEYPACGSRDRRPARMLSQHRHSDPNAAPSGPPSSKRTHEAFQDRAVRDGRVRPDRLHAGRHGRSRLARQ